MPQIFPNDPWRLFADSRPATSYVHADAAACGRSSQATLRAVAAHAEREAVAGAYVAAAEAAPVLAQGRRGLAALLGVEPDGTAFTESATAALAALLRAWPLSVGDTVAVVPSEWGPNLDAFADRGLRLASLTVDSSGLVDLDALRQFLAVTLPAFVHLTLVASHRPLVQPAAEVAAVCHEFGVPLWLDAAQALGHVNVAACGADVAYAPARKWLCGPRGVGVIAVRPSWARRLRPRVSEMDRTAVGDGSPVLLLESREAHVAGRIGLCNAVTEFFAGGPSAVWERLASVGASTRAALAEVPGWSVVGDVSAPSAITALRPLAGQDVAAVRQRLLTDHQIVTTAALPVRAPGDMSEAYLRISPHVDWGEEALGKLAAALTTVLCRRSRRP
ncbi:MAG TPA: aminotransferase class V-fold PLP-dependent enzyme [Trebonia sp.]|jgi:pyridoxal 5-phosphate dependent beta-lyase|nr:aminotransferase class V-fold PLP-dependent enzyme [Trebonia sp.]